ncbi:MAG: hypothetical protein AB1499_05860, partial [Nitrospirota bacterium]
MKKIIISLIILLTGVLSLLIYSAINETPPSSTVAGNGVVKDNKAEVVSVKHSPGFINNSLSPIEKIDETVEGEDEYQKPSGNITEKKAAIKAEENRLEVSSAEKETPVVKEKAETVAAPVKEVKRKEEAAAAEKESGQTVETKPAVVAKAPSVKAESIKAAPPVV